MTPTFKKLNYKDQREVLIVNPPSEFEDEVLAMKQVTSVKNDINEVEDFDFILTFVKTRNEIDAVVPIIDHKLRGDGVVWFAYPKGTSKKYKAEINRDNGWEMLGKKGFEGVRAVAIDDDWSALRFRRVEYIKTMKRRESFAMTKEGRAKTNPKSGGKKPDRNI